MIVDVRSREEFIKEHIKGAYNFPLQDLEYYLDFFRDQSIEL
ncbi:MAG: rhodanese-like domain-containing protein, partial [Candidatus Hodarchaeota archaeon]